MLVCTRPQTTCFASRYIVGSAALSVGADPDEFVPVENTLPSGPIGHADEDDFGTMYAFAIDFTKTKDDSARAFRDLMFGDMPPGDS